jgi:hypothetical protein
MKKIILAIYTVVVSSSAFAYTFQDLAGTYKVTSKVTATVNTVTISEKGKLSLFEKSPEGTMDCSGLAKINNDVVSSDMKCKNGFEFSQTVDFSNVRSLDVFEAPVFSTLFDATIVMKFERISP